MKSTLSKLIEHAQKKKHKHIEIKTAEGAIVLNTPQVTK